MKRTERKHRHAVRWSAIVVAAAALTGCSAVNADTGFLQQASPTPSSAQPGPAAAASSASVDASQALAMLDTLPVKGRAPKTGYSRAQFGQAWTDDVNVEFGHDGCDTRNNILMRDLTNVTVKPGTRGCVVASGDLDDPYTGTLIHFVRGPNSAVVQIDHAVALSDSWQKGAQQLSAEQRQDLANDPRNLLAVNGITNQQKSDGDAATWLPPNKPFRCSYVRQQILVKKLYHLWVTAAEKAAMVRVLTNC